jgi:hypothetical protein
MRADRLSGARLKKVTFDFNYAMLKKVCVMHAKGSDCMRKIAVVMIMTLLAVAMVGCGGTAKQTSGSSYNYSANSYK